MRQLWITGTALALLMAANLGRADEAAAVKVIAKAGGTIIVDDKQAEKPVVGVIMWGPGFHGGLLKEPKDLKSLHKLRIGGPWITDDGIKELSQLKSLQVLEVRSPKVTDGALKELQEALPNLTFRRAAPGEKPFDTWITIFNGKNLDGWHVSAMTGHSSKSKNKSGGRWVVDNGVMVGSQDIPGNGGIIITDKKFKNFEVVLEMNNDFGPDSGLFLRCNDKGQCYQAMIDYHAKGNLMGIYGEGIGGQPNVANFKFLDKVTDIVENDKSPFKLPVSPADWPKFWKHGEWNELKARIENNPPKITTWIKGVKFMEFQDDKMRLPDEGGIALQVHGGGDYTKQFVRYRNIRVKFLD